MRISVVLCWMIITLGQASAQVYSIDTAKFINPATPIPGHPRLLLLKGEEEQIKNSVKTQRIWREVHTEIIRQTDSIIDTKPVERILFGVRLLAKSRYALHRIFNLSYAWRMTRDKKYLIRAEQELLAVANFSDWNPSHYLDVAEMTMAVAIGYDWLYNDLSEKSRNIIREAIITKGIATSFDSQYPNYRKWLSVTNNWNQVCNAGISFGALAIYESDPVLAQKVVNRSVASIDIAMKDYDPEGAFAEGYTYWGYGTTFNIMFLNAIEKIFKTDFGLTKQKGFLKTAGYLEHIVGPTGKSFNYSDASEKAVLQPATFWFASKLKDPSLIWNERVFLTKERIKENSDRLLPAIMIWGKGIEMDKITPPSAKFWTGSGRNPVAFMRSSWTDPNAVFVGIKGGSPSVTHGHMDAGSFVMDADGIRWAMDFGFQEYTALELKNINLWADKQDGQRWEIFRYNNFSHNTLTVNNELQRVDGSAPILGFSNNPKFSNAVTDLTPSYKTLLSKAQRGVAICDGKYVLVKDEINTLDKETTIRWAILTPADVKLNGNKAELTKNGKKLTLVVKGIKADMKTWTTTPPRDYDEPNPGTTLVGFEVTVPASTSQSFEVFMLPGNTDIDPNIDIKPLREWFK